MQWTLAEMKQTEWRSTADQTSCGGVSEALLPELAPAPQLARLLARARRLESGQLTWWGGLCLGLYRCRFLRPILRSLVEYLDGGNRLSPTWRAIAQEYYGVRIGAYTYGPRLRPGDFPPGTTVGRYCSIAHGLIVLRRNHPTNFASQHPFFFNAEVGLLREDAVKRPEANPLTIGHDVWIGARVIILPGCRQIGDGAVVGAGAVVTRDVEPYRIVAGNPARVIRPRFDPEIEALVRASAWWRRSLEELLPHLELLTQPVTVDRARRLCALFARSSGTSGIRCT
jgi:acetyltransferase-like isoleucine patch superfamily enzyme